MAQTQIEPQAPPLVVPLDLQWPIVTLNIVSRHFDHYHLLDTIVLCYPMQYWQIPMILIEKMAKTLILGPFWPLFAQFWAPTFFFRKSGFVTF